MGEVDIRDLIGKPFVYGGKGEKGWDCFTLSREVLHRAGIEIPQQETLRNMIFQALEFKNQVENYYIELDKPEPWCTVAFRIKSKDITHMGVVLEDCTRFIHVMYHRNVLVEDLSFPYWEQHIKGFYRYVGKD
ncbi:MAG: C40 family peptidase [Candidatus Peribacteraceae bacterium]|nr:C40 family peptidase [Candidatus Peribacteraceae bacterium]